MKLFPTGRDSSRNGPGPPEEKEECAVLAAEALGKLANPCRDRDVRAGEEKGSAAVRQACTMALTQLHKQSKASTPQPTL